MRCSTQTEKFSDVIEIAARYFGLPKDIVFLSDCEDGGCIFLNEQDVFNEIFPMRTAKRVKINPVLHIVLQRRQASLDLVDNQRDLKEAEKELNEI